MFTASHMHVLLSMVYQCGAVHLDILNTFNIYDYYKHQLICDLSFHSNIEEEYGLLEYNAMLTSHLFLAHCRSLLPVSSV